MVLEGANIVSHMGDYPSHAHSEKERKEKAGETLIARTTSVLVAEEPPCCKNNQKVSKIRTHPQDTKTRSIKTAPYLDIDGYILSCAMLQFVISDHIYEENK